MATEVFASLSQQKNAPMLRIVYILWPDASSRVRPIRLARCLEACRSDINKTKQIMSFVEKRVKSAKRRKTQFITPEIYKINLFAITTFKNNEFVYNITFFVIIYMLVLFL